MTTHPDPARVGGFALVSAIFLIVGLAALGAFALTVSSFAHVGSALEVRSAHAYYAARAGVEWGAAQTLGAAYCGATPNANVGTFNGMAVTVTCATLAEGDADEAGLGRIHALSATACSHPLAGACPGDAAAVNYVERRISVLVER